MLGEEVVGEAVVALPLADAAGGVARPDVRPIVVAPRDEVVVAVAAEPVQQLTGETGASDPRQTQRGQRGREALCVESGGE